MKKKSKVEIFLELAKPDEYGFSRKVSIEEIEGNGLKMGNGGDWCREDGTLGNKYLINRIKEKNKIIAVELCGFNTKNKIAKGIRKDIWNEIKTQRCAALYIGDVEVDHKDGRRDDYGNFNPENQKIEQFQPLSKAPNNTKKQHCKNCRKTNIRFDAKLLGFIKSQWAGDEKYRGTCVGCYWHDIKKFNQEISNNNII